MMMENSQNNADLGPRWYAVHTYSGYENAVASTINKYVDNRGLRDVIQTVSIPLETVTEITDNGPKEVERKVFPGYVLVKMVLTDETWHIVRNIRGVTGFVGAGNNAIPLTDSEVQALGVEPNDAAGTGSGGIILPYAVGDNVRIIDGPFTTYIGVVDELDINKRRVRIIVSASSREIPIELDLNQVEKIQED